MPRGGPHPNCRRRQRVVRLRSKGLTLQEIADRMGCSRQNVHELLANIGQGASERAGHLHCRQCKAALCRRRQGMWMVRPTLCLDCLSKWPEAPFGERLRAFRLARGMTTDELALKAGVSILTVNSHERTEAIRFEWPTLLRLARVLGVELLTLGLDQHGEEE
jgi:transcriptional regulator with XRE-family HTH domain